MHMDSIKINDKVVLRVKKQILDAINEFGIELSIHDFRMVGDEKYCNVIFDMVIPYEVRDNKNVVMTYRRLSRRSIHSIILLS